MTFALFLLTPFIFGCAVYRVLSIPSQLRNGTITLKNPLSMASRILAIIGYLMLLGGSLALCYGVYQTLTSNMSDIKALLKSAAYFELYPVLYLLAEWRFYHAFSRPDKAPAATQTA